MLAFIDIHVSQTHALLSVASISASIERHALRKASVELIPESKVPIDPHDTLRRRQQHENQHAARLITRKSPVAL